MERPKFAKPKPVMLVSDYPIKSEIEQDSPYSSASNMTLMGDLHRAGIKQKDCNFTYLSYSRPDKESYDFLYDFAKLKTLEPMGLELGKSGEVFHKLEHQKDLYVSDRLYREFLGLLMQIKQCEPKLIVITGKWSLFFLSGTITYTATQGNFRDAKPLGGLAKYRASVLAPWEGFNLPDIVMFPMLPPTVAYRQQEKIPIMKWDMGKAGAIAGELLAGTPSSHYLKSENDFYIGQDINIIRSKFLQIYTELEKKPTLLSVDIETRHATIDCIGFTTKANSGLCLALSTLSEPNLWGIETEIELVGWVRTILTHRNARLVLQNGSYDLQYLYKFWLMDLEVFLDTMVLHHVLYNYMEKRLDFLASVYCEQYVYWKAMQDHKD